MDFLADYYEWLKVLHIIAVISWMAGMLYLPRLYVYHSRVSIGSESDDLFKIMEYRLLKYIINPSMIATIIFGLLLSYIYGLEALGDWYYIKLASVIGLVFAHIMFAKWRKAFAIGQRIHGENFYRVMNEVPTIMMIIAVIMVILKPFE